MEHSVLILNVLDFKSKKDDSDYCRIEYMILDKEFLGDNDYIYGYNVLNTIVKGHFKDSFKSKKMLVNANCIGTFKSIKDYKNPLISTIRLSGVRYNNDSISLL